MMPEFLAEVGAPEAVSAENAIRAANEGPDLVGKQLHVVGCCDDRRIPARREARGDIRLALLFERMEHVPALHLHGLAPQLGEARYAPHITRHTEILLEQLGA